MTTASVTSITRRRPPAFGFGDRLRKGRREMAMNQEDFAVLAGVTPASLSAYESGIRTPPHKELLKIASRLERATGWPSEWWVLGLDTTGGDGDGGQSGEVPPPKWEVAGSIPAEGTNHRHLRVAA